MMYDYIEPAVGWTIAGILWAVVVLMAIVNHLKGKS